MSQVYFLQMGANGPVKIGYSTNLKARITAISQGLPYYPTLLLTLDGGRELELRLHRALHRSHIRLEWFKPSRELFALVAIAKSKGQDAVHRWLANCEAEHIVPPAPPPTDDFDKDILALSALAFRQAVARFGKEAVAAQIDRSVDRVESLCAGRSEPPASVFINLSLLDPGATLPVFARAGFIPDWVAAPGRPAA